MQKTLPCLLAMWVLIPDTGAAQPTLDSLWPNADGLRWDYKITVENDSLPGGSFTTDAAMTLVGTVETPGGTAQVLHTSHGLSPATGGCCLPVRSLTCSPVSTRWYPSLLHGNYFMKTATRIQMWERELVCDQPYWTYLTSSLAVGDTFTQPFPCSGSDGFLHGTVAAIDATVSTPAGTFTNAVRIDYRVVDGWSECADENGNPLFRFRAETRGHVHYVPDVGPVDLLEDFIPVAETEGDGCGCPVHFSVQTIRMLLTRGPVPVAPITWTGVKRLYR